MVLLGIHWGQFPEEWEIKTSKNPCRPEGELFCAIGAQDNAKVAELIAKGIDVNAPGPIGGYGTPPDLPPLKTDEASGLRPWETDIPLCLASRTGNIDATSLLLQHGANINAFCEGATTPLGDAAGYGQEGIVHFLLGHGADPNLTDTKSGEAWSPLMHAVNGPDGTWQEGPNDRPKQRRILIRLLAAGADPTYKVSSGAQAGQDALYRTNVEYLHDPVMAKSLRRAIIKWRANHPAK
jgi:hypothetical protein